MKAMSDPALLEEAKQKRLEITPVSGDELAKIRHYHFVIRRLHGQVATLYQKLAPPGPEKLKVIE